MAGSRRGLEADIAAATGRRASAVGHDRLDLGLLGGVKRKARRAGQVAFRGP